MVVFRDDFLSEINVTKSALSMTKPVFTCHLPQVNGRVHP